MWDGWKGREGWKKLEKGGLSNVRVLHKTWGLGYLY